MLFLWASAVEGLETKCFVASANGPSVPFALKLVSNTPSPPDTVILLANAYVELVTSLLTNEAWSRQASLIAADPALRQAIVGTLLAYCLPALAAEVRSGLPAGLPASSLPSSLMYTLPSLLLHPSLAPAGHEQAAEAAAAVEQAAAMFSSVAAAPPNSMPGNKYASALTNAAALLSVCIQIVNGSCSEETGTSSSQEAALAGSQAEQHVAGWQVAELLPSLKAAVAAVADNLQQQPPSTEAGDGLPDLGALFLNLRQALSMMSGLRLSDSSPQQVCTWLAAASAGLQLLPCTTQLAERAVPPSQSGHIAYFVEILLSLFVDALPRQLHQLLEFLHRMRASSSSSQQAVPPGEAAALDRLPAQLWALHTSLCRLIASLSAPVAPLRWPGQQLSSAHWRLLLSVLNTLLVAIVHSHSNRRRVLASGTPSWHQHSAPEMPK